jgi:hypothetical protein
MMVGMYFAILDVTSLLTTAYLGLVAPFAAALATVPLMLAVDYCLHRFLVTQTFCRETFP